MLKSVFVTVGSTSFDDLIEVLCSESSLQLLKNHGFREITFQIGNGKFIPPESSKFLDVKWYRFKDSLTEDIRSASVVIGHAGAGTILESLLEGKSLVVVTNDHLMDNHQSELAEKLASEGYLRYSSSSKLLDTLREVLENGPGNKTCFRASQDMFYPVLEYILGLK